MGSGCGGSQRPAEACLAGTDYPGDGGRLRDGGDHLYGMTTADVLGRLFVFERSSRAWPTSSGGSPRSTYSPPRQVWIISAGLGEYAFRWSSFEWHRLDIAHFIGVAVPVFTSHVDHRHFFFAKIAVQDA